MGHLTNREIENAKPRDKPYKLIDGDGLQLRVAVSGVRTWLVRYFVGTKEKQCSLPNPYGKGTGLCGLSEARDKAREIRAMAREHRDYVIELERARAEETEKSAQLMRQKARPTVETVFERWIELDLASRKDKGADTKRSMTKDVLPAIGHKLAAEIQRADIMTILDHVMARGAKRMASRLLSEMRQMFEFAEVRELIEKNPTHGIERKHIGGRETERDRTLSEDEIKLLPSRLAAANMIDTTKHAIWAMLATLTRIGELTRARKADIDLSAARWTIPSEHAKNGKDHTVYLSAFATKHLAALLALSDDDVWVFPSTRNDGSICTKSITKQIYDRQRGKQKKNGTAMISALTLPGGRWTPHDLRRTGATIMGELGVHSDTIEKCLNHLEQSKIKRTYQRAVRELEQRDAWRVLGERLAALSLCETNLIPVRHRTRSVKTAS